MFAEKKKEQLSSPTGLNYLKREQGNLKLTIFYVQVYFLARFSFVTLCYYCVFVFVLCVCVFDCIAEAPYDYQGEPRKFFLNVEVRL